LKNRDNEPFCMFKVMQKVRVEIIDYRGFSPGITI
jgi:hypothetical protein